MNHWRFVLQIPLFYTIKLTTILQLKHLNRPQCTRTAMINCGNTLLPHPIPVLAGGRGALSLTNQSVTTVNHSLRGYSFITTVRHTWAPLTTTPLEIPQIAHCSYLFVFSLHFGLVFLW